MLKTYTLLVFFILCLIFMVFPELDLWIVTLFYHPQDGFVHGSHSLTQFPYQVMPTITYIYGFGCLFLIGYQAYRRKRIITSPAFYLLVAVLVGPGLLVNYGLKENFGRARPREIVEFKGSKSFTGPLVMGNQTLQNGSFSSGHAAMGYNLSALSYVVPVYSNLIFLGGVLFGSLVGFGRVLQGGHFPSDVIFSGFFVLLINQVWFLLWRRLCRKRQEKTAVA